MGGNEWLERDGVWAWPRGRRVLKTDEGWNDALHSFLCQEVKISIWGGCLFERDLSNDKFFIKRNI